LASWLLSGGCYWAGIKSSACLRAAPDTDPADPENAERALNLISAWIFYENEWINCLISAGRQRENARTYGSINFDHPAGSGVFNWNG